MVLPIVKQWKDCYSNINQFLALFMYCSLCIFCRQFSISFALFISPSLCFAMRLRCWAISKICIEKQPFRMTQSNSSHTNISSFFFRIQLKRLCFDFIYGETTASILRENKGANLYLRCVRLCVFHRFTALTKHPPTEHQTSTEPSAKDYLYTYQWMKQFEKSKLNRQNKCPASDWCSNENVIFIVMFLFLPLLFRPCVFNAWNRQTLRPWSISIISTISHYLHFNLISKPISILYFFFLLQMQRPEVCVWKMELNTIENFQIITTFFSVVKWKRMLITMPQ